MHWSDVYLGRPYLPGEYDCAALAVDVQRDVFGRRVDLPAERPADPQTSAALLSVLQADHVVRLADPEEGCIVLMRRGAEGEWHVGTWFCAVAEGWVLHLTRTPLGATVAKVRVLARLGFQIEGYYRWK